jgi:hypothetical protein
LYASPNIIRINKSWRVRWSGHVVCTGEKRNTYRVLMKKPKRKRSLGRRRYKWEGDVKMDLREIEWSGVDWNNLAQDNDQWRAFVNKVTNFRVP